jgi:hypothetical protein
MVDRSEVVVPPDEELVVGVEMDNCGLVAYVRS